MTDAGLPLAGQAAAVTGGARGIGKGIVLELARAGADLPEEDMHATAAEVRALGRRVLTRRVDVTDVTGQSVNVDGGFTFH